MAKLLSILAEQEGSAPTRASGLPEERLLDQLGPAVERRLLAEGGRAGLRVELHVPRDLLHQLVQRGAQAVLPLQLLEQEVREQPVHLDLLLEQLLLRLLPLLR